MSAIRIEPDLGFVRELRQAGGGTVKQCFQCATCSVTCELSTDEQPFPRREMLWAQWGLRDKLLADPNVFLCHECHDCTAVCPRGARPGDVLSAARRATIAHFAFPSFLGRWVRAPALVTLLLGLAFVFIGVVIEQTNTLAIPTGRIVFAKFAPGQVLEILFSTVSSLALVAFVVSGVRYWRAMARAGFAPASFFAGLWPTVRQILWHERFKKCTPPRRRLAAHAMVFGGFVALAITAGLAAFKQLVLGEAPPLPLTDPVKILGNLGALSLLIGGAILIRRRVTGEGGVRSTFGDNLFLGSLYLVGLTGALSEVIRLAGSPSAYWVYFVHLAFVIFVLGTAPYTKFAHLLYRTLAMIAAVQQGRREAGAPGR